MMKCFLQIYDAVCAMEPGNDYGRKTITTAGAVGEWFENHALQGWAEGKDPCTSIHSWRPAFAPGAGGNK